MSTPKPSTELQLVAALAAMSEANLAMRTGAVSTPAISRAARCLECLAESADLAPALRVKCEQMSWHWEAAMSPQIEPGSEQPPSADARVIQMQRRQSRRQDWLPTHATVKNYESPLHGKTGACWRC